MKKLSSMVGILLLGCSAEAGDDPPRVIQVDPLENGTELAPALLPVRVGHVEIDHSEIDFVQVFTTSDAAPEENRQESSIIVMQKGFVGERDPVAEVFASSDLPLTTAELYMGLRGSRAYLPEALALSHFSEAADLGRTPEFLDAFRKPLPVRAPAPEADIPLETDKAALFLPTQILDEAFTTAVPGRRWTNVQVGANGFNCMGQCPSSTPIPTIRSYWGCSNRASFETIGYYNLPVANSCAATRTRGWLRSGVMLDMDSRQTETATMQGFYGPSVDGQWVSYPSETIARGQYVTWDWNTTASKAMTIAVSRAASQVSAVRIMTGISVPN
jgi:hypothetical protein